MRQRLWNKISTDRFVVPVLKILCSTIAASKNERVYNSTESAVKNVFGPFLQTMTNFDRPISTPFTIGFVVPLSCVTINTKAASPDRAIKAASSLFRDCRLNNTALISLSSNLLTSLKITFA